MVAQEAWSLQICLFISLCQMVRVAGTAKAAKPTVFLLRKQAAAVITSRISVSSWWVLYRQTKQQLEHFTRTSSHSVSSLISGCIQRTNKRLRQSDLDSALLSGLWYFLRLSGYHSDHVSCLWVSHFQRNVYIYLILTAVCSTLPTFICAAIARHRMLEGEATIHMLFLC